MTITSIPSPEINSVSIGPFTVYFYAICIISGILLATLFTGRRLTKRGAEPGIIIDFTILAVLFGIVGARIYHVLTHIPDYFGSDKELWKVVAIWEGGIAIFGALIGGAVGIYIASKYTGLRFWVFVDALAPALLLAQAIGRLGNWFNQELYGSPSTLPWALEISSDNNNFPIGLPEDTLFHPTFLYEIIWNLLGIVFILLLEKKLVLQWGKAIAVYFIWYGLGRMFLETLRLDPIGSYFGLRYNFITAILLVLLGVVLFIVQSRRHPGIVPNVYREDFVKKINEEKKESMRDTYQLDSDNNVIDLKVNEKNNDNDVVEEEIKSK